MLVVDLSENDVATPLCVVARSQHLPVARHELPGQIDQAQLLRDLSSRADRGSVGTLRAGADDVGLRMLDSDLLKGIADRLGSTRHLRPAGRRPARPGGKSYHTPSGPGPLSGQEAPAARRLCRCRGPG